MKVLLSTPIRLFNVIYWGLLESAVLLIVRISFLLACFMMRLVLRINVSRTEAVNRHVFRASCDF